MQSIPVIHNSETIQLSVVDIENLLNSTLKEDEQDLAPVNKQIASQVFAELINNLSWPDVLTSIIRTVRVMIIDDPRYSFVAARLLNMIQELEVKDYFNVGSENLEKTTFKLSIEAGVTLGHLSPLTVQLFDLDILRDALKPERNSNFTYLGMQTLYDRYFRHHGDVRYELPQQFFMRVSMGLAFNEPEATRNETTIDFYNQLSNFNYMSSTPTLFNTASNRSQLSSCYLSTIPDDLYGIFSAIQDDAMLSKFAGGLGNDWTPVRALNSHIKGTNGKSQGIVPFLKVANDTAVAVNQGGKRKGAMCGYLETWHLDIEEFLELRKNTGDDRRRTHDMNTANWIPDLFMKRVIDNGDWTLFTPSETPDLHDLYGKPFQVRYEQYEANAVKDGMLHRVVKAADLWRKMLSMLFETGHPWFTWKDACNIRSPQRHAGVIHSSNLCCIAKDQLVTTDKGLVSIDELYLTQVEPIVSGRGHLAQASAMLLPRPNAPMVKIITKEGYTHKVTPDHRVWVVGKGKVEAQYLIEGDKIELQVTQQHGIVDKPNLAFLTGLLAGDGTYTDSGVRIDLWKGKTDHLGGEVISKLLDVLRTSDVDLGNRANLNVELRENDQKIYLHSAALAKILEEEQVDKSDKLVVPDFVLKGTKDTVGQYLRGLFLTDGTVSSSGDVTTASLSSVNRNLLETVQILLLGLGIKSSITGLFPKGYRELPDGKGGSALYPCQESFRLHVTSIKACKLLEEHTGIGEARQNHKYVANLSKDGYVQKMHATFSGLEELPNEDAYCLTVDSEDHAWTVNGFITHNTEITLNTSDTEVAVCNLGSINLVKHVVETDGVATLDYDKLRNTVSLAVKMLDNVIDINFYPIKQAKVSNLRHRPIGLGIMGFHDMLYMLEIPYESPEAIAIADLVMEHISFYAITASHELALERGSYPSFQGSDWSNGILPIDTIKRLKEERGEEFCLMDESINSDLDWVGLRDKVKLGMRNSNLLAIAPTASISNIVGVSQSIEPTFQNTYVKSNLSGEFIVTNPYMVAALRKLGLWSVALGREINDHDGSLADIEGIPDSIKLLFKTAFEVHPSYLINAASRRQKWICQAQSLNLYIAGANGKKLDRTYRNAWLAGLKTTYYLRSMSATSTEKSTGSGKSKLNAVDVSTLAKPVSEIEALACSIDNPDCESCQ